MSSPEGGKIGLGEGGTGVVWRAVDTTLDREVAIKLLPAALGSDPERLARFDREAKLLASLSHPNVAGIYGAHEVEGTRYLAMELVEGEFCPSGWPAVRFRSTTRSSWRGRSRRSMKLPGSRRLRVSSTPPVDTTGSTSNTGAKPICPS